MNAKVRRVIAYIGLSLALCLGGIGLIVTFVPGVEAKWFGGVAVFAAFGLLSPDWREKFVAVSLVVICALTVLLSRF